MKFNKLLVFGFIVCCNYIEASQVINIPPITNIIEERNSIDNKMALYNGSDELYGGIVSNINKYQQIQENSIYEVLNYSYTILKIFVSNNCSNNESQKMQNYINIMSGLV